MKKYIKPETSVEVVELEALMACSNNDRGHRPPGWDNEHNPHYDEEWPHKEKFPWDGED